MEISSMFQETVETILKVKTEKKLQSYLTALQAVATAKGPAPSYEQPLGYCMPRDQLESAAETMRPHFRAEAETEIRKNLWDVLAKDR